MIRGKSRITERNSRSLDNESDEGQEKGSGSKPQGGKSKKNVCPPFSALILPRKQKLASMEVGANVQERVRVKRGRGDAQRKLELKRINDTRTSRRLRSSNCNQRQYSNSFFHTRFDCRSLAAKPAETRRETRLELLKTVFRKTRQKHSLLPARCKKPRPSC